MKRWLAQLVWWQKALLSIGSILTAGIVWGSTLPPLPPSEPATAIEVPAPQIKTKTVEEKTEVPFEIQSINDATLLKGETTVKQAGKVGEKTTVYEVQIQDGQEISRKVVAETISVAPTTEIKAVGTKSPPTKHIPSYAPNGTYKNVDGNTVPSPYYAPSAPAGATAKCRDGTYSFSQSRRGTCSHHGGVASWL